MVCGNLEYIDQFEFAQSFPRQIGTTCTIKDMDWIEFDLKAVSTNWLYLTYDYSVINLYKRLGNIHIGKLFVTQLSQRNSYIDCWWNDQGM